MSSGHLVTDSDLPLLGDIHLGELHHTVCEIISDLHFVNRPLVGCGSLLVGDAVVVDEIPDHLIGVGVVSPAVGIDIAVVNGLELSGGDLLSFRNKLNTVEVEDSGALPALGESGKLVEELGIQCLGLPVEILLNAVELGLLLGPCALAVAFLGHLGVEGGLDHGTAEGRICLEGCILDVSGLVAENRPEEFLLR